MNARTEISSLTVSVPGVVQDRFKTNDKRPTRFSYTMRQEIEFGEVKDMFGSMVPKVKQMRRDMLDELSDSDACGYGYENHLPLDSIEVQDESGVIYLICGIAQENPVSKNYWISEPESIRIKIKASNQCPESRMSRKHLLAQVSVPTSCPEFYMSRKYLGMYHTIYSALNAELVELLTSTADPENFSTIEGYSLIPDILRKKRNKAIDYLEENELEPSIYIPTYQHDMLAEGVGKDEDYGSLVFTCDDKESHINFSTQVVNDLQYMLCLEQHFAYDIEEAGLGDRFRFRLSDLIGKINLYGRLYIGLFYPAPGKFKQSSGNTEFRYGYSLEYDKSEDLLKNAESIADAFKNALQEAKTARDDIIAKLSEIKSVEFPLAMIENDYTGEEPQRIRIISRLIPSYEGNKLNPKFAGSEGPNLYMTFPVEEFLTEEGLITCRDICTLVRSKIHKLLKGVTEFSDREDYDGVPEVLKKQSFWTKAEALMEKVGDGSVEIPCYLRDALIDKQHELLPFTRDKGNVFKTADTYSGIYSLTLSNASGLSDTCKLPDLMRKKITNLSVNYNDGYRLYTINKTIPGNEVSEQFKIASQTLRKLKDASGVGEAIVNISDECIEMEVFLVGYRRLNGTYSGPLDLKLKILLSNDSILQKFLTEDRLKICGDVCKLVRRKICKLLKAVTKFSREEDYVDVPELLRKQSFWYKVEALLNQISDDVSISIPRYIHDALTDILPEACDTSSDSDDESSEEEYDQQA